ncbi:MAG: polysaccharide deacetylase family protein [Clostridia bacterium]|nr:polysaccharide deacetylase family protein [Clostridia bacterium]
MKRIGGYICKPTRKYLICGTALCLFSFCLFLSSVIVPTSKISDGKIPLPVIMYHSVLEDESRSGKYVVTPDILESDFKYLSENGYKTVTVSDLLAYKKGETELPEKCIMLTFDDGYYNNYSYLFPLLKKYNFRAVLSVVGRYTDEYSNSGEKMNNNYSHATWAQLKEMQDSGYIEIQNHSYDLHDWSQRKGVLRKKGEDFEHYKEYITADIMKMQGKLKENMGKEAVCFAYPFGSVNKESREIVEGIGFEVTLGCEEGVNYIDKSHPLKELKRCNRPDRPETKEFFEKLLLNKP